MKMSVGAKRLFSNMEAEGLNIAANLEGDNPEIPYFDELQGMGLIITERTEEGGVAWVRLTSKGRLIKKQLK